MKDIIESWTSSKSKSIRSAKDNFKRMKRQAIDGEKIFAKNTSDKGLLPKFAKNS